VRCRSGIWRGNEPSPEMPSLALDTACLGSAHITGAAVLNLTDAPDAEQYRRDLLRQAAVVHLAARHVHGLD
jgi:hypothetical protein